MRFLSLSVILLSLTATTTVAKSISVDIYTRSFDKQKGGEFNEHFNGTMTIDQRTLTITPNGIGAPAPHGSNGAVSYDAEGEIQSIKRGGGRANKQ